MKGITKPKGFGIAAAAMLITALLVGVVFASAVSGDGSKEPELAIGDLQDMYRRYNVTENDVLFATNELPNYLNGTILDSDTRVIATRTGEPPEGLKEGEEYDIVISTKEMRAIIEDAKERYIEKYGVDPANPKLDVVDGIPLPNEEVERLVKSGKIKDLGHAEPLAGIRGGPHEGPHAINGRIDISIFVATDSRHRPTQDIVGDTGDALYRFVQEFGVSNDIRWYWNYWDASDVSPADSCSDALDDIAGDCSWAVTQENDIVIGWLHDMDHNGMAYWDGFYAVCSDTAIGKPDWPHDSIVQHEVSHLFYADDHGYWGPVCIMTYYYAWQGTDVWCSSCRATVNENIWGD
ncbi:MAG: hypothetical protein U9N61_09250 [Euryarchaeota archaeon]|nr:hypothetical protein [Euryarchaeota archaeon]